MQRGAGTSTAAAAAMQPNIPTKLPIEEEYESENDHKSGKEISQEPHDAVELSPEPPKQTLPEARGREGVAAEGSGRERLKRHRVEVAGRVWIPDVWGQEGFLRDWADCAAFDAALVGSSILSARDSLVAEGRRASSTRLRVHNGC